MMIRHTVAYTRMYIYKCSNSNELTALVLRLRSVEK